MSMDHGNTGFQVAPVSTPTESEMEQVRTVFQRMADAIVGAASLTKEVEELRHTVQNLQWDTEALRRRNKELDEQVAEVRRQRDEAKDEAAKQRDRSLIFESELSMAKSQLEDARRQRDDLASQLDLAKKDRDDASFRNLELTEERDQAKHELEQVINILKPIWDRMQPKPQPVPQVQPHEPVYNYPPEPTEPKPEPTEDTRPWWEKNKSTEQSQF